LVLALHATYWLCSTKWRDGKWSRLGTDPDNRTRLLFSRYANFSDWVKDGDDVKGKVKIEMLKGKSKVDHLGIRVELIGVIENLFDKT